MKNDHYTLKARKYPTIVSLILPAMITVVFLWPYLDQIYNQYQTLLKVISCFVPVALLYGAFGFFGWTLAQGLSKAIIQQPKYKADESDMPTTILLLWADKTLSEQHKKDIHDKIRSKYGLNLLSREQEKNNPDEAKKVIVDAVGRMRDDTRKDNMLLEYNIKYGFLRNYLGASIIALLITLVLWSINMWVENPISNQWFYYGIGVHLLFFVLVFRSVNASAYDYAKQLFRVFLRIQ